MYVENNNSFQPNYQELMKRPQQRKLHAKGHMLKISVK